MKHAQESPSYLAAHTISDLEMNCGDIWLKPGRISTFLNLLLLRDISHQITATQKLQIRHNLGLVIMSVMLHQIQFT